MNGNNVVRMLWIFIFFGTLKEMKVKEYNFISNLNTNGPEIFVKKIISAKVYINLWKRTSKSSLMKSKRWLRSALLVYRSDLSQKSGDHRWPLNFSNLQFTGLSGGSAIWKTYLIPTVPFLFQKPFCNMHSQLHMCSHPAQGKSKI